MAQAGANLPYKTERTLPDLSVIQNIQSLAIQSPEQGPHPTNQA